MPKVKPHLLSATSLVRLIEGGELTAEAIVDSQTLIFDLRAIEYFALRDIEVARELWKLAARDLDYAVDHMLLLGRKTARSSSWTMLLRTTRLAV